MVSPQFRDGEYVLSDHGDVSKIIDREEYVRPRSEGIRALAAAICSISVLSFIHCSRMRTFDSD
jgi:hypothetical protein